MEWSYEILKAVTIFLGALGGMVLKRSGIVYTAIVGHFILTSVLLGYASRLGLPFAIGTAFLLGVALISLGLLAAQYNRTTYIAVLYVCSLLSMPAANLIMRAFPADAHRPGLASPAIRWTMDDLTTAFIAVLVSATVWVGSICIARTRGQALLTHWSQSSATVARDLDRAKIFTLARVFRAAVPTIVCASACFTTAVLFGCFVTDGAYTMNKFDILPFWMLLLGLAANGREGIIVVLVVVYAAVDSLIGQAARSAVGQIPTQAIYVLFGLLLLVLTVVGAERQPATRSIAKS